MSTATNSGAVCSSGIGSPFCLLDREASLFKDTSHCSWFYDRTRVQCYCDPARPSSARATAKTLSSIGSVRRPVLVFWRLGW
jgi:hypothetical protein